MRTATMLSLYIAATSTLLGQTTAAPDFTPLSALQAGGIHMYGLTVYSGYYVSGAPAAFGNSFQNDLNPGASAMGGLTATFGGSKMAEKSTFSWSYSPSYFTTLYSQTPASNSGSLNQNANVSFSRKLAKNWTLSTSASAMIANMQQLYSSPLAVSGLTAPSSNPNVPGFGLPAGSQGSVALPEQAYLYGSRMLDVTTHVALSWAPSTRSSYSVSASGTRFQTLNGAGTIGSATPLSGVVLPQTTTASLAAEWSYALSPRTRISTQISSSRVFSRLEQGYASNVLLSVSRDLSRRWFVQFRGGAGKLTYAQQMYAAPAAIQRIFGGSAGFKGAAQTIELSYDRTLGDPYGLGSGTTSGVTGGWSWKHPGSAWSLSASGGLQQLNNSAFSNTTSWRATAGIARSISPYMFMSMQYVYSQLPTSLQRTGLNNSENGVVMSVTMSPSRHQ